MNGKIVLALAINAILPYLLIAQCTINVSEDPICGGGTVEISIADPTPGADYQWDLNDDRVPDLKGSSFSQNLPAVRRDSILRLGLYQDGRLCASKQVTVRAAPDPSVGVAPGPATLSGTTIKACNGASSFELTFFNASRTMAQNTRYSINWGDGSPAEEYTNSNFSNTRTISHVYRRLGYYDIFVTAEHQNGCSLTKKYTFYNGGNPSVGLAIPGNTVGLCAPATLQFPITNTEGNPPGTEYTIFVKGKVVGRYTQENLPDVFTYTFEESSCGATTSTENYQNAFDLRIVASNPCNSSSATIEPIELSTPPTPYIRVIPPENRCEGNPYIIRNESDAQEVISGSPSSCVEILSPSWSISGRAGTDWELKSGSLFGAQQIEVNFLKAGVFTIEMTIISFSCGEFTYSQEIKVFEPPVAVAELDFSASPTGSASCTPFDLPLKSNVSGDSVTMRWEIEPSTGWRFLDRATNLSPNPTVRFEQGGDFTIKLLASNPCVTTEWDSTIFIPGPPTVSMPPLEDVCGATTLDFTDIPITFIENGSPVTGVTWAFRGAETVVSKDSFPRNIRYEDPGTYVVRVELENRCGFSVYRDTFEIQEPTELILPEDRAICRNGDPIKLTALPKGGRWRGPQIYNNVFDPARVAPGKYPFIYTYGVGICQDADTMMIEVLPLPKVEAGGPFLVCSHEAPIDLSGASPPGGVWEISNPALIQNNRFLPGKAQSGSFNLRYTYTDANQCTSSDVLSITVNPTPKLTAKDTSLCNVAGNVSLPAPNIPGGYWDGQGITDRLGKFDPRAAGGAGSYPVRYHYRTDEGCETSVEVRVGVIDPAAVDAGQDTTICAFDDEFDLSLYTNFPGGDWKTNSGGLHGQFFNPSQAGLGMHRITYLIGEGVCAVEDSVLINVISLPSVRAGADQALCPKADPIRLSPAKPAGGVWSGPGLIDETIGIFDPKLAGSGEHYMTYTFQDENSGCINSVQEKVTVYPSPAPDFKIPETVCAGFLFGLENTSAGGSGYLWSFSDGRTAIVKNPKHVFDATGKYTITLKAESIYGCTEQITKPIFVTTIPDLDLNIETRDTCGEKVAFVDNLSQGYGTQYYWDFGNGRVYDGPNPDFPLFYPAGQQDTAYLIELNAENICGTARILDTVKIRSLPEANFGMAIDTGCATLRVKFANISLGSDLAYRWDLGNGLTYAGEHPPDQAYALREGDDATPYQITLITRNACGSDTLSKEITVVPDTIHAFINISRQSGCAPFAVEFEHFSTPGTRVNWDFGDGYRSELPNPSHTFREPGRHRVWLYAFNECARDSAFVDIDALGPPVVDFDYTDNLCFGQNVEFTPVSDRLDDLVWVFGAADTVRQRRASYVFPDPGDYTVRLFGRSMDSGCTASLSKRVSIKAPPVPAFSLAGAAGCVPLRIQFQDQSSGARFYSWDFGDGNTSTARSPEHLFTKAGDFTVRLRVYDEIGCATDTTYGPIRAYPLPDPDFSYEKEQACGLPVDVQFTSETEGGESVIWQFDNIGISTLRHPVQTFSRPGSFPVLMTVRNRFGCEASVEKEIRFTEQPVAAFDLENIGGCQPLRVLFSNFSDAETFHWDFGDGNTSTQRAPTHIYRDAGQFDVTLIASNDGICFDTLELQSAVSVLKQPIASFRWQTRDQTGAFQGLIQFINESVRADTYFWDFGDGETSEERDPQHRYFAEGQKSVLLRVFSVDGCESDTSISFLPDLFSSLYVPNAFSPEQGLGEAKLFLPKGIGLKEYHLQIFSPYGQLLWESSALKDGQPAEGWDGVYQGTLLPQDVYVWKIKATFEDGTRWPGSPQQGGGYSRIGSVTLLR